MASSQARGLLANVVDEIASTAPNTPWVFVPCNDANLQEGYKPITFGQLSRSVNKLARWIERTIGVTHSGETIAFMDRSNDIRYTFLILAAIKTGYKTLLTSTRNSSEGQKHLIRSTNCSKFLHGVESKSEIESLRDEETEFKPFQIPSLEELLDGDSEHYVSKGSSDPMETVVIIHTSGSTGLPKPINLRNGYIASAYLLTQQTSPNGRDNICRIFFGSQKSLCTLPFFHAMGLFSVIKSISSQGPLVLPPVGRVATAELNLEMIKAGAPEIGLVPPSILEDLVELPGGLEALETLQFICFAGAPLALEAGNKISKVTKIQTVIGSTECSILDSYVNEDPADWMYFEWCPWAGSHMAPSDELHELVIKRKDLEIQGAFFSFPEIEEWRTKDLYSAHPTKPGLWQYRGRNDDVIVLSNGEKFNPISFEKYVEGHANVKGAIVVGQGCFQAGLVLELKNPVDPEVFLEEIWPTIEQANDLVAAHGRVWKSKVAFAKPGKEFVRAPKGNIVRRRTNEAFQDEINAIYSNEGFADQLGELSSQASHAEVKSFIQQAIRLTMPYVPQDIDENADIFAYGVDSLQVLGLSSALSHALPKVAGVRDSAVKARTIYGNPSVYALTQAIHDVLHGVGADKPTISREQRIAETVNRYTADLPSPITYNPRQQKHAIILTGSTGGLGNYLLEYLIAAPSVGKIYCLNRSDAETRQRRSFEERGASADFSKVKFLQTSFDKERFGLAPGLYQELLDHVDVFIHNAWAVDFNKGLESFENVHVAGTRRCIDFSAASQYHAHLVFISSIASTGNWLGSGHSGFVPEVWMDDDSLPFPQGYGESKHVAGRILAVAAEKSGIASSIVRVGQIAGPTGERGIWGHQEWLPSIISSSKEIGKVPRTLGNQDVIDWVPVDSAAHVVLDLGQTRLGTQSSKKLDVFHLVNPNVVNWSELVPTVQDFYASAGTKLEVVEFSEWLSVMKSLPMTQEQVKKTPGLKLLDFYDGISAAEGSLPRMATEHTAESSITLRELAPINKELIHNWIKQWNY